MPILLFLIDTSASMNQRAYLGTSYLDIAKGAVEIFMKVSARRRGSRRPLAPFAPLTPLLSALSAAAGPGPGQPRRQVHAGYVRRAALLHQGNDPPGRLGSSAGPPLARRGPVRPGGGSSSL